MQWLKDAIVEYINNNPDRHLDSVDIAVYFKLRVDIIMNALHELQEEGLIQQIYIGINTRYTTNKES